MKTNVSIKFNSLEEYRVIEKKLDDLIFYTLSDGVYYHDNNKTYNNLEEFLTDNNLK